MISAIVPELMLLVLAGLVMLVDLVGRGRRSLGWFAASGLAVILVVTILAGAPSADEGLVFGGMLRHDWPAFSFKVIFLFSAAVTCLLSLDVPGTGTRGEYYSLLIVATLGMCLMAAASDLIMLYLAVETTSIPLYVLAGFLKQDDKSAESGMKYFLFGALTSAVMLYGFSLLYGVTGETGLYVLVDKIRMGQISPWFLSGAVILILTGFGFKVAAVPFHFWTPDVYEGAPTPITAFIS